MKKLLVPILILLFFVGCDRDSNNADNIQKQQTDKLMSEANRQIGLPNITNFQQKKMMKMIFEETDKENLVCYAYLQSKWTGKLVYLGKCLGYGVPFSAQFTNPEKLVDRYGGEVNAGQDAYQMPQPDPNGLFMPTSSSATWLMMLDEAGKPHPVYLEPEIVVSPFKLDLQ